jgi:hypothetical protein
MHRSTHDKTKPPRTLDEALALAGLPSASPDPRADAPWSELPVPAMAQHHRRALEGLLDEHPAWAVHLDVVLCELHEIETAADGLPEVVGHVRRAELWGHDVATTTWRGWNVRTGAPEIVRCLRPAFCVDPVWRRRLQRGVQLGRTFEGVAPMRWVDGSGTGAAWPHVGISLSRRPLSDFLPAEDPPELAGLFRFLLVALARLDAFHQRKMAHGALSPRHLLPGPDGPMICWTDPIRQVDPPMSTDIRALAACIRELDPAELHPASDLCLPWLVAPPTSATEAIRQVRQAMTEHLLAERHALFRRGRRRGHLSRNVRLHSLVQRLSHLVPPPGGRCVLRAAEDGVLALVESTAGCVRGGLMADFQPTRDVSDAGERPSRRWLPPVWDPESGLDALAARTLMRAWARRDSGQPERCREAQQRWGGDEASGERLVRWLAAQCRLRAIRLLLEHSLRAD